jgi:hypothetical protein
VADRISRVLIPLCVPLGPVAKLIDAEHTRPKPLFCSGEAGLGLTLTNACESAKHGRFGLLRRDAFEVAILTHRHGLGLEALLVHLPLQGAFLELEQHQAQTALALAEMFDDDIVPLPAQAVVAVVHAVDQGVEHVDLHADDLLNLGALVVRLLVPAHKFKH